MPDMILQGRDLSVTALFSYPKNIREKSNVTLSQNSCAQLSQSIGMLCATYTNFVTYIDAPDMILQGRDLSVTATITAIMNLLSTQLS